MIIFFIAAVIFTDFFRCFRHYFLRSIILALPPITLAIFHADFQLIAAYAAC
jgi:hypothetical protein